MNEEFLMAGVVRDSEIASSDGLYPVHKF